MILGAGLDTYAYRTPPSDDLRIFEVDHPATQAWKRERLAEAGIAVPPGLHFVAVDFERETLADRLDAAGFDPARPAFFSWLGVVPYLTETAVFATLGFIAGLPGGAACGVRLRQSRGIDGNAGAARRASALAERVAALGETLQCHFDSDELGARLQTLGFRAVDDLGPGEISQRFFPGRAAFSGGGAHVVHATTL